MSKQRMTLVKIAFPNDAYSDEDYISPADIDKESNASYPVRMGRPIRCTLILNKYSYRLFYVPLLLEDL